MGPRCATLPCVSLTPPRALPLPLLLRVLLRSLLLTVQACYAPCTPCARSGGYLNKCSQRRPRTAPLPPIYRLATNLLRVLSTVVLSEKIPPVCLTLSCVVSLRALLHFSPTGRAQASLLRRLVADTAGLVKLTGSFYDRYSDTHRARAVPATAAAGAVPPVVVGADGGLAGNKFPRKFIYGSRRETEFGDNYGTDGGSHAMGGAGGANRHDASGNSGASAMLNPPQSAETSRNNLDRTAEYGAGRTHAGFDGAAVRELDRRCYSLLEANAQLCLRLQGLGLEYAGLTRELLDSGPKLVSNSSLDQNSEQQKKACQRARNTYNKYEVVHSW